MKKAVDLYREFHSLEPEHVQEFDRRFRIPEEVFRAGEAAFVLYRSRKVDPATGERPKKSFDYIHKHDPGVRLYFVDEDMGGRARRVPKWIREAPALVRLGHCLGFGFFDDDGGAVEGKGRRPYPDLYTTPNGKALLVIQDRRELIALVWGGRLCVEWRGIVH